MQHRKTVALKNTIAVDANFAQFLRESVETTGHSIGIMTKSSLLLLAWCTIAANPLFSNKWLCDETWFRLTHARYPTLRYIGDTTAGVARGKFTAALSKFYATEASPDQSNPNDVYHVQFFHVCPYTDKNRRVNYF